MRVAGVRAIRSGQEIELRASREVVLSQGAIRTPQTMMLSGIGDREHLTRHSITSVLHAPEVGCNFHDHILHGGCIWESPKPMIHRNSGANASSFWKSNPALDRPDMNIVQIELPYASDFIAKEYAPPGNAWALCAGLVDPRSRGDVRLPAGGIRGPMRPWRAVVDAPLFDNDLGFPEAVEDHAIEQFTH